MRKKRQRRGPQGVSRIPIRKLKKKNSKTKDQIKAIKAELGKTDLTEDQKALVTNYAALQALEAQLVVLTNEAAAAPVITAITSLPTVEVLKLTDETAVEAARTAYDALTGVYKALEANGETLDLDRTQVAQDELETTNEIAENNADNSNFDSGRLDQAMVEIKQELAEIKKNQGDRKSVV